ncbi:MAG TPA: ATP-dependent DNA helicase RecG [Bacteroidales bacterium]|nr:ATP-dependent DNA helicase RecG [Bacteroidales bacterium]
MPNLTDNIQFVPGVGPKRAELLAKHLNIVSIEDMLYFFPYKYIDRSKFYTISELSEDMQYVQLKGKITDYKTVGEGRAKRLIATFSDNTGSIELIWFNAFQWIQKSVPLFANIVILGKPTIFNRSFNITHPEIELWVNYEQSINKGLQPYYSIPEKLKQQQISSKTILKIQQTILKTYYNSIQDPLPGEIIMRNKLIPLKDALFQIHFPTNLDELKKAQYRLKFEELFYIQLNILNLKKFRQNNIHGFIFYKEKDYYTKLLFHQLPFSLTGAQIKVLSEIRKDVTTGKQMNRLLQGDVGSGKTIVALMAMLMAVDNGFQACLMAPTEILAQQHFATLNELCNNLPLKIELLTGSSKTSERKNIHHGLRSGEIHILIGTHALIEDTVQFKNLGLVVIDEQHRFGVAQRAKLWQKNSLEPHILVMTATPIPRTLAMTVYGDLDVSVIDELPPGRKPIKTVHLTDSKRLTLFKFIKEQIHLGRQMYVVFPLIKESENFDYKDLEDGYESYSREFPPPHYFIAVVHGQMKPQEKEISMNNFVKGKAQIMIATTVIEVGVNVPNASVMIIESAERFGLSQLHQLRGRVGRGNDQSYCILMTKHELSKEARQRIAIMCESNDGFYIAEKDMELRGPGDIEGTQQSGMPFELKIASITSDEPIMALARKEASELLATNKDLTNYPSLLTKLKKLKNEKIDWSKIS